MKNRKFQVQKNEILETARALFWEKGYDGTSLKDIANSCGFEASNVYYYYASKEDILYAALRVELDQLIADTEPLREAAGRTPVERLKIFIDAEIKTHLGEHRLQGMLIDSELRNLTPEHRQEVIALRNRHDEILAQVISDGIEQGCFKDVDVKLTVYTISSVIIRSRMWFSSKGRVSLKEYSQFLYDFMLSALEAR